MIKPVIRHLQEADYPALYDLFDGEGWQHMRGWKFTDALVALHKEELVGFVAAWHGGQPYAWVDCLVVRPDLRKHGIGAWLCFHVEKMLKDRGVRAIRAAVETPTVLLGLKKWGFHGTRQFVMERFYECP